MQDSGHIEVALAELEARLARATDEADHARMQLERARATMSSLRAAIDGLQAVIALEAQPGPADVPIVEAPAAKPAATAPEATSAPSVDLRWPEAGMTVRKRVRSTQYVGELLANEPRTWSFEEIVKAFARDGVSDSMVHPEGAIRTAIGRAVKKGTVVMVDEDHFRPSDFTTTEGD